MEFLSTQNPRLRASFSTAVQDNVPGDGGLFMPARLEALPTSRHCSSSRAAAFGRDPGAAPRAEARPRRSRIAGLLRVRLPGASRARRRRGRGARALSRADALLQGLRRAVSCACARPAPLSRGRDARANRAHGDQRRHRRRRSAGLLAAAGLQRRGALSERPGLGAAGAPVHDLGRKRAGLRDRGLVRRLSGAGEPMLRGRRAGERPRPALGELDQCRTPDRTGLVLLRGCRKEVTTRQSRHFCAEWKLRQPLRRADRQRLGAPIASRSSPPTTTAPYPTISPAVSYAPRPTSRHQ